MSINALESTVCQVHRVLDRMDGCQDFPLGVAMCNPALEVWGGDQIRAAALTELSRPSGWRALREWAEERKDYRDLISVAYALAQVAPEADSFGMVKYIVEACLRILADRVSGHVGTWRFEGRVQYVLDGVRAVLWAAPDDWSYRLLPEADRLVLN